MFKKITAITAITLIGASALFGTTLNAAEVSTLEGITSAEATGAIEQTQTSSTENVAGTTRAQSYFHYWSQKMSQGREYSGDFTNDSSRMNTRLVHNDSDNNDVTSKIVMYKRDGIWEKYTDYTTKLTYKGDYDSHIKDDSKLVKARMGMHVTPTYISGGSSAEYMQYGWIDTNK